MWFSCCQAQTGWWELCRQIYLAWSNYRSVVNSAIKNWLYWVSVVFVFYCDIVLLTHIHLWGNICCQLFADSPWSWNIGCLCLSLKTIKKCVISIHFSLLCKWKYFQLVFFFFMFVKLETHSLWNVSNYDKNVLFFLLQIKTWNNLNIVADTDILNL